MTDKRLPPKVIPLTALDQNVAVLRTYLPRRLLRAVRLHAALDAKSLDDFVREAIEEGLRR